ncbi:MAG TPA: DoxX family protein [Flavisolibacter sp.]|nr:DoxX family protein [Flavisolibacter sp.]
MKPFFSATARWQNEGLAIVRIITGFFMVYHGWEVFDAEKMKTYLEWDQFKTSSASLVVHLGKTAELVGGLLLMFGLFTRPAALIIACTMLYISLFVGTGKILYEDQHPFLFVLLALVFFFAGPAKWSLDQVFFTNSRK